MLQKDVNIIVIVLQKDVKTNTIKMSIEIEGVKYNAKT